MTRLAVSRLRSYRSKSFPSERLIGALGDHTSREASAARINSTIDLEDIVLVRKTAVRCDLIFHANPINRPETPCTRRDSMRSRTFLASRV